MADKYWSGWSISKRLDEVLDTAGEMEDSIYKDVAALEADAKAYRELLKHPLAAALGGIICASMQRKNRDGKLKTEV